MVRYNAEYIKDLSAIAAKETHKKAHKLADKLADEAVNSWWNRHVSKKTRSEIRKNLFDKHPEVLEYNNLYKFFCEFEAKCELALVAGDGFIELDAADVTWVSTWIPRQEKE